MNTTETRQQLTRTRRPREKHATANALCRGLRELTHTFTRRNITQKNTTPHAHPPQTRTRNKATPADKTQQNNKNTAHRHEEDSNDKTRQDETKISAGQLAEQESHHPDPNSLRQTKGLAKTNNKKNKPKTTQQTPANHKQQDT